MSTQSTQFKLTLITVALGFVAPVAVGDPPAPQRPAQQLDDSASLERQFQALTSMPSVDVTYNKFGRVTYITGDTGLVLRDPTRFRKGDDADEVLSVLKDVLLASGRETVTFSSNAVWVGTIRTIKVRQTIRGRPVLGGVFALTVDSVTGRITEISSQFLPDVGLPQEPQISADDAVAAVRKNLVEAGFAVEGTVAVDTRPSLAYVARPTDDERPKLVWRVQTQYMQPDDELRHVEVWVNAVNGSIVQVDEPSRAALSRTVYTAHNHNPPPADSGLPSGLTQVSASFDSYSQAAYDHVGTAYNAWNSFGENYGAVRIVVHYGQGSETTRFYHGTNDYLLLADGTSEVLAASKDRDTVAHEFGHGVFEDDIDDVWSKIGTDDPVALDEGFGDMSAVITDIWARGGAATTSTWNLYQRYLPDPLLPRVSWSNPKSVNTTFADWYPDRWKGFDAKHRNATVLGHAYYLLVNGGSHVRQGQPSIADGGVIPNIVVPSQGPDKTARIFFVALNSATMNADPTYLKLRTATENAANALYGVTARDAVTKAWQAVGVGYKCSVPPGSVNYAVQSDYCRGGHRVTWTPTSGALSYEGAVVDQRLGPSEGAWEYGYTVVHAGSAETSCRFSIPVGMYFRMRGCNGCGCGPWGLAWALYYYSPCL